MFRRVGGFVAAVMATCSIQAASAADPVQAPLPPVEDYGKLPAMEQVSLSPSGTRYTSVITANGARQVIVATITNQLLQVVPVGGVKVVDLQWAGDDHLLITTSTTVNLGPEFEISKQELEAVVSINLNTHKLTFIFNGPYGHSVANVVTGHYGSALLNGRWYGFFGGYTYISDGRPKLDEDNRLCPDLYRVDLDTGELRLAASGQGDLTDWLVGPDGGVIARSFYNEKSGAWRVTAGGHSEVLLASGRDEFSGAGILGLGKTAGDLLIEIPTQEGAVDEEVALRGGTPRKIDEDGMVANALIDPVTHLWSGVTQENDNLTVKLFDPMRQARLTGAYKAFPGHVAHLVSASADFNHLIMFTDGGDDSGTYWIVNFDRGAGGADVLGVAYPTVSEAFVGSVKMIDYKAADGLALRGMLTLPPGRDPKNLPVVVMPHGGPAARDYPSFDYWAQAFAVRGYAVFQPNFRGSSGYGHSFRNAGFGQWGRKMQTDISDGLADLVRRGVVDPKRACIVGGSYGGYAALAGVTVQQGLYRCSVSLAGVADLSRFLTFARDESGGASSTTRYWKTFMGVTSNWNDAQVRDVSPAQLASRADAPILLIHGADDTTVPIEQSQVMLRALKAAGKSVEMVTLPGSDHWLLHEDARLTTLKASVAFVMKNNPPDPAPAPVAAK